MKEQHPIDELFARALRDGHAPPPPAVREGIARQRGWKAGNGGLHRAWPLLLLLLGATASYYWLASPANRTGTTATKLVATKQSASAVSTGASAPESDQPAGESLSAMGATPQAIPVSPAPRLPESDNTDTGHKASDQPAQPAPPAKQAMEGGVFQAKAQPKVASGHTGQALALAAASQATHPAPAVSPEQQAQAGPAQAEHAKPGPEAASPIVLSALPNLLAVRWPPLSPDMSTSAPITAIAHSFRGPRHGWWVAATAGFLAETRTWKGGNGDLRQALQGTEVPHPATAFGVLAGRESRGGWNLATGIEYSTSRYNFNHTDRFRSRTDSVVTWMITFNSQVISSHTDTLSLYGNVQQSIAAINRVSTVRVPVELGWHRAVRRFHLGGRAGLAAELNFIRSGATLARMDGGTRTVDASKADDRTTLLLAGTVAADIGYVLSEQWSLWASPTFGTGLFPLSAASEAPYALPQRFGVRFRLAYTLKSAH